MKPHWINITGRSRGEKFKCSDCGGECICKFYGGSKITNMCNYQFCPRCGKEMDLNGQTKYQVVEVKAESEDVE